MNEKPEFLYRGVVIKYEQLKDFNFYGVDLRPPHEPIIDSQGRETVLDGNEYGVYMTDNEKMVDSAYGNVHGGGTKIREDITIGSLRENIKIPDIGISYIINTEGMDVHIPWISDQLRGHYNNGYEGNEWIATVIPSENYSVKRIRIGDDLLHDIQDVPIDDIDKAISETKRIMEERKERLEVFAEEMSKIPETKRRMFTGDEIDVFKDIYGENGAKYINEDNIDISSSNNAIKYLVAKVYKENPQEMDLTKLKYIEQLRWKLTKTKNPENSNSIKEIILKEIEKDEQKKSDFIKRKEGEGQIPNTRGFDTRISMMNDVLRKFIERQSERTLFSEQEIGKATIDMPTKVKDETKSRVQKEEQNQEKTQEVE